MNSKTRFQCYVYLNGLHNWFKTEILELKQYFAYTVSYKMYKDNSRCIL